MVKISVIQTKYRALDNQKIFEIGVHGVKTIEAVDDYYMVQYNNMVLTIPCNNIASLITKDLNDIHLPKI